MKVAHPLMLRAIAAAKKKNDRIDAGKIADCLRCDLNRARGEQRTHRFSIHQLHGDIVRAVLVPEFLIATSRSRRLSLAR